MSGPAGPESEGGVTYGTLMGDNTPGPGETPTIKIALVAEISGEWVTPDVITETCRTLAQTLAARLREAAEDIAQLG